ncbi:universal stress protein [Mycolicibacterium gadium]|uniref:Universal stress protein n=1 Tax=Mycolicibacterium gadium TaxID=1794 RepID=A0A7I7WPT3_MYCGU|nr:universal stress protein [Mycolicibacterium gadium]BBZ17928.1 universal stress protein [Mycolicibacterium gadium]
MEDTVNPVVVGVDGTDNAMRAARWAAGVAHKLGTPLHIVHARPYPGHNPSDVIAAVRACEMSAQQERASAILDAASRAVHDEHPDLRITTAHVSEAVDRLLVDLSQHARLVVLGCDDLSVAEAVLIGSTTVAVAANSMCPVVAWRGEATAPTGQPIVVGVNDDDPSRVAITSAFELADRFAVNIIAVHAWSTRRSVGDVTLPFMIDWNAVHADQREHLVNALAPWTLQYPEVDVQYVVDQDKPSRALLNHSDGAQLVVIGSRGRGPLAGAVLGSTGLNLLHHSLVPTMICRSMGARGDVSFEHQFRERAQE